jgi:hypothetical protein
VIVADTVFVAVLITDTVPELLLATYTLVPSRLGFTPRGALPTGTVATTAFVAVSMTETLLLDPLLFAT